MGLTSTRRISKIKQYDVFYLKIIVVNIYIFAKYLHIVLGGLFSFQNSLQVDAMDLCQATNARRLKNFFVNLGDFKWNSKQLTDSCILQMFSSSMCNTHQPFLDEM